jgi:diadenylate cyclase
MPNELWQYLQSRSATDLARDVLDVLITYYVFYRVSLVLKGTRAMQILLGIAGVFVLYVVAELLRLHTVLTLLTAVLSSAILIVVVVFQNDIRRGLMRMGGRARLSTGQTLEGKLIDDVVEAAQILAKHRTGAIITLEQEANLDEFVGSHQGHVIDATVTPELLVSMFIPEAMNKLHDGAVVIRDLRIAKAGVFFPMPEGRVADESFGSRHRAAMGITEETDAVVVVVSEERGSISFCFNGNIIPNLDGPRLRAALDGVFGPKRTVTRKATSLFAFFRRSPTEAPKSVRASTPPRTTRTPLRRKIQENSTTSLRVAEGRKGQAQVGAGTGLEPLRKRPKTPEHPSVTLEHTPEHPSHEPTATATPLRVRQLPPPPEDDRVSLLEESSFHPSVPRKVRDSVPPAAPVPNLRSDQPAGPGDKPLRHITRPTSPGKDESAPPRNESRNEPRQELRNESRGPSHEDTLRSLSSPPRALTADEGADRTAIPNLPRPLTTPPEAPDHESSARERAEPTA